MKSLIFFIFFLTILSVNVFAREDNKTLTYEKKEKSHSRHKYNDRKDNNEEEEKVEVEKVEVEEVEVEEEEKERNINKQENKISGLMTKITKEYVLINETKYMFSPDTIIKYQSGNIIKNIAIFKAAESVNVTANIINDYTIKELIIGMSILRD